MKTTVILIAMLIGAASAHAIESQKVIVRQAAYDNSIWELVGLTSEIGPIRPMSEEVADTLLSLSSSTIYKCSVKSFHEKSSKFNLVYSLQNCEIF